MLWIFFYIRRKSRIRRIDRDTEVEAAVAAAGFGRTLLDDDAPRSPPHSGSQYSTQMAQRNIPSYVPVGLGQSVSGPLLDDDNVAFNPYAGYAIESRPSAVGGRYTRARTASPPPGAERQGPSGSGTDDMGDSSRERKSSYGHTPTYSVGSYEPLLAAYTQGTSADPGANSPPTPPPRNPQRILDASPEHRANVNSLPGYSSDGSADARLDPEIRRRTRSDSLGSDDLRDDEDYSRPMLTVSSSALFCPKVVLRFCRSATCLIVVVRILHCDDLHVCGLVLHPFSEKKVDCCVISVGLRLICWADIIIFIYIPHLHSVYHHNPWTYGRLFALDCILSPQVNLVPLFLNCGFIMCYTSACL